MIRLHKISLTQYKNYSFSSFEFKERVTGICGLNGRGKTNLLDAIYYCCFTKSYFSRNDLHNVQFDREGFRLESHFELGGKQHNLTCINRGQGKKELLMNGVAYEKFSQHIGKFPVVMVAPDDIDLIRGNSEERRSFMDTVLCQMDGDYLQHLIVYNKVLLQRNSLLKQFAELGKTDIQLLEVIDGQLVIPGNQIYTKRKLFTEKFIPLVQKIYGQIAGNEEIINLQYLSGLNENEMAVLLKLTREKDLILQRTGAGIHRDEIEFQLNDQPFKTTASQGQRKSLLFALKLAEFEILKENKGYAPLLMLDDVFEKLDDGRMQQLLQCVCKENDGQVFITDTHRERLEETFGSLGVGYGVVELDN